MHMLATKPTQKSKKGRELDDKQFNSNERKQFDGADAANWEKHLRLGAAEVIPPEQAAKLMKEKCRRAS